MKPKEEDAYEAHLAHILQKGGSNYQQPWDRCSIQNPAPVFQRLPKHRKCVLSARAPPTGPSVPSPDGEDGFAKAGLTGGRSSASGKGTSWLLKLTLDRRLAIKKWMSVLERFPSDFDLSLQAHRDKERGVDDALATSLEHAFAAKSTSTLSCRVSPILRYIKHCDLVQVAAFSLEEHAVYEFIRTYGMASAPTFPRSFMCSLVFARHVLGLKGVDACLSARATGAVKQRYMTKRKTVQKPPLSVDQVMALETAVITEGQLCVEDRIAAGFFCFAIYARARFSDAQAAGAIALDVAVHDGETVGYIQADVSRSKTSYSLERKVRFLSMVAPIYGLHPESWALAYMKLLDEHGPERSDNKPLLPVRVADGWGQLPESGGKILRSILYQSGCDVAKVKLLGTHSLKATALSWCAKFGLERVTRATLGYHASGRQGTELIYGRDNIASPLRDLERVIQEVAMKRFFPDSTRSGYISKKPDEQYEELSDSSSQGSENEDQPDHSEDEQAADAMVGQFGPVPLEERGLFRHKISRVIHVCDSEEGLVFKCQRKVSSSYAALSSAPLVMHPLCKQCFPDGVEG